MLVEVKSLHDIRATPYLKMQPLEAIYAYDVFQYEVQPLGV
jgi:hypothetical protein